MEEAVTHSERAQSFRGLFDDRTALRDWFDASHPRIHSFVFARCGGNEAVAQDITQETFVEVVRRRRSFDGRSDPITWVIGIARHKIADHYRRAYRERRKELELIETEASQQTSRDEIDQVDAREAVLAALQVLPEAQGVVVALHYLDGLSIKEIARSLGRSQSAVESLLARGRERFKRAYLDRSDER